MTNTIKSLPFTCRQIIHVEGITLPEGVVSLWDIINLELVQVYTNDELRSMGQGVVSKINSIIRKVRTHWTVGQVENLNKSVECNWSGPTVTTVTTLVEDDVRSFVKSLM